MESYIPLITGSGGALVVLAIVAYLLGIGKLHSDQEFSKLEADNTRKDEVIDRLQEALTLERQRSNDATSAGTVNLQLIDGLIKLATEHRAAEAADVKAVLPAAPLDLTGKDIGL